VISIIMGFRDTGCYRAHMYGARGWGLKARIKNRTRGGGILMFRANFHDLSRPGFS
jgi:hypothetical protein